MTKALVEELRAGLEGTTKGTWFVSTDDDGLWVDVERAGVCLITRGEPRDYEIKDAHHIARCSPENIAALLDHIEALSSENERLKADLVFADEQAKKLEALLEPHIKWEDAPVRSSTEEER